jgi:hypothetical protein
MRESRALSAVILLPIVLKIHLLIGLFTPNPIYVFSGLATASHGRVLPGLSSIDPNVGTVSQALGHAAARELLHGRMPWWNFYQGVGGPLAGEMQSAALFPLTPLLLLPEGQLYFHILLQIVAGVSTFLVARRLGLSPLASCLAGILFECNGTFSWLANAAVNPISFLPLVLLGVETTRGRAEAGRGGGWLWIALGVALSLYAGFPEVAYLDGLLILIWTLARTGGLGKTEGPRFVGRAALGAFTGLLLAAPILVAFLDFLPDAFVGHHDGKGYEQAYLPPASLVSLALPYAFGFVFQENGVFPLGFWTKVGGYGGVGLLTLAVCAMSGTRLRPLRLALFGWAAVALAASYGLAGIAGLVRLLPGVGISNFARFLPASWEFALIMLAAFTIDDLGEGAAARRLFRIAIPAVLAFIGIGLLVLAPVLLTGHPPRFVLPAPIGSLAFGLLILAGFWAAGSRPAPGGAVAAVCAFEALICFLLPTLANPRQVALATGGVRFLEDNLGNQRFFTLRPLQPNYGAYFGIAGVNNQDLPLPRGWVDFVADRLDDNTDPMAFDGANRRDPGGPSAAANFLKNEAAFEQAGVKYALTSPGAEPAGWADGRLTKVFADPVMTIWQLPDPQPYFSAEGCALRIQSRNSLVSDCQVASKLVRLEYYAEGWRARVNGEDRAVARSEPIFQEIDLPAGEATIAFSFTPPFMTAGYIAFAAGLLLLFAGLGRTASLDRVVRLSV